MSHRDTPALPAWERDALGIERARIDAHGASATLAPVAGGYWWQVYWRPTRVDGVRRDAGARQGNAADRDAAEQAAYGAYRLGRP